jgi:starch synthase
MEPARVGGLIDTVVDSGAAGGPAEGANGILFDGEEPEDMMAAMDRALELFARSGDWQAMQRSAMAVDFSWSSPAGQYIKLYEEIAPADDRHLFSDAQPTAPAEPRQYKTA